MLKVLFFQERLNITGLSLLKHGDANF